MKAIWIFLGSCCLAIALGCTKSTPSGPQQILALREMSDLATVEYVVTKIIKANDNKTWYKLGDRKILMSCRATIKAGIDLSAIQPEYIKIKEKSVALAIPSAKIISLNMPPEDIVVEYQDIDPLRSGFKAGERDALAAQAEAQIRASAAGMGILQTAEANAKQFLTQFLQRLGYNDITITTGNLPSTTPKKD